MRNGMIGNVAGDHGAGTNASPAANPHLGQHPRSHAQFRSFSDMRATADQRSRGDGHEILQHAIVTEMNMMMSTHVAANADVASCKQPRTKHCPCSDPDGVVMQHLWLNQGR